MGRWRVDWGPSFSMFISVCGTGQATSKGQPVVPGQVSISPQVTKEDLKS